MRRRNDCTNIQTGIFTYVDPCGVNEQHFPGRIDSSVDRAGIRIGHAIQCRCVCIRLIKIYRCIFTDVEGVPIYNCTLTCLVHIHNWGTSRATR